jgi:hypothetical protein
METSALSWLSGLLVNHVKVLGRRLLLLVVDSGNRKFEKPVQRATLLTIHIA